MDLKAYNAYTGEYETVNLSIWKILKVILGFPQSVGLRQYTKWISPTEFYIIYCFGKGFVIDYVHGYSNRLRCGEDEGFA